MSNRHFACRAHRAMGFTLIELLVTVAIAAILLGIAVPSFRDMAIRNRLTGYTNEVIATVNLARSEAVRRGGFVSICPSANSQTNAPSCSGTWSDGWIVFVNLDNDAVVDADDIVLKAYEALAPRYTLGSDASFATVLTYRSEGSASSTGMFALCHDNSLAGSRAVIVTPLRARVARDSDNDRIPNRDDTNDISDCSAPSGS